jgi:hypothetical protein
MRPGTALLGCLTIPLLLLACGEHQALPTGPAASPDLALIAGKPVSLDPSHTYRFGLTCSSAAPGAQVSVITATNIPRIDFPCNSSTELGAAYGTAFSEFAYELALGTPTDKVCSATGVTMTGSFKCRSRKYTATLTVIDEGVVTP